MSSELKNALKSLQGFSALSDAVLDQLTAFASMRIVRTGETIFCQGEPSPFCFGILSGEVIIQHVSKDKRFPPKILGALGPGHLFGESAVFEESPRAAMASAQQDGKLVVIRGLALRQWITENPALGQPFLLALLQSSLSRLHRTSQELAIIYGIGRLLGSDKPFPEQLSAALEFLKSSLEGVDDLVFYRRSAYWEEFTPLYCLPEISGLPAVAATHELIQQGLLAGRAPFWNPQTLKNSLAALKLPWENRAAFAVIPLFDWDKASDPLQGLLVMASARNAQAFSPEKHLLLSAITHPFAEALARHARQEEASAAIRLEQSKSPFPQ